MPVHLVFTLFPLRLLSVSVSSVEGQSSTLLIRLAARGLGHFLGDAVNAVCPAGAPDVSGRQQELRGGGCGWAGRASLCLS